MTIDMRNYILCLPLFANPTKNAALAYLYQ
jgi:hypothetical protein